MTEALLYSNPLRVWSALSTAGKATSTVSVLPAASATVTVAVAAFASAVFGVPPITPVAPSMARPDGRPAAW